MLNKQLIVILLIYLTLDTGDLLAQVRWLLRSNTRLKQRRFIFGAEGLAPLHVRYRMRASNLFILNWFNKSHFR